MLIILSGVSCKSKRQAVSQKETQTIEGTFESKKGVMNIVSCFCHNSGYLKSKTGEEIPVCISDEKADVSCEKVKMTGEYVTITHEKENNGVCPATTMTYFRVSSFSCK